MLGMTTSGERWDLRSLLKGSSRKRGAVLCRREEMPCSGLGGTVLCRSVWGAKLAGEQSMWQVGR